MKKMATAVGLLQVLLCCFLLMAASSMFCTVISGQVFLHSESASSNASSEGCAHEVFPETRDILFRECNPLSGGEKDHKGEDANEETTVAIAVDADTNTSWGEKTLTKLRVSALERRNLAEETVSDINALLEFKRGIIKDPDGVLQGWNESKSHCHWEGVTCDNQTDRVVGLNITGDYNSSMKKYDKQISGTISPSLSLLSELKALILQSHNLTGEIPAQLGRLTFLQVLNLHGNNVVGEIPNELSSCSELRELDVGSNNLTGELPIQLVQCISLETIDVSSNKLRGTINPGFGRLQNLTHFLAMHNNFHGTIPTSFGNCSMLQSLALNNNNLTGSIPDSLANCSELQGFLIGYNNISGSIPPAMGRLQKLSIFYVQFNQLEGDLLFLQNCSAIWQIHGEGNNFTGPLPRFGNCENLTHIFVSNNEFSGIIPPSWGECPKLEVLNLSNNTELTGTIPPKSFGKLQRLRTFAITNTKIYGSIPSSLGNCTKLRAILLYNNPELAGTIPSELFDKTRNLEYLFIYNTKISGSIPSALVNSTKLKRMLLYNNRLTGWIPTTLGSCILLQQIMLENNQLDGEFGVNMGNMSNLQTLSFANNSIIGDVSKLFSRLPKSGKLLVLDTSRNLLKGVLPSTSYLSPFSSLKVLMLGHNKLEGSIPSWLWSLPSLQVIDISNNRLIGTVSDDFNNLEGYIDTNGSQHSQDEGEFFNRNISSTTLYNQNLVLTIKTYSVSYSFTLSILTSMDLSANQLSGNISTNISQLAKLQYLNLSQNMFSGEIPKTISSIPLQQLDLSSNLLVGGIPQQLGSQSHLSSLGLANNNLSGPIPTGPQISTFHVESFLPGNDGLCGPPLPLSRSCQVPDMPTVQDAEEASEPFSDIFNHVSFVLGLVVGFVSVACIFLCWGPAQNFIHIDHLKIQRVRVHNEAVGLWRPPM